MNTAEWHGKTLAQRYRIEAVVGEGGFGVVYRAHHLWLDVPVAVKALRVSPEWSAERQQRMLSKFLVEAQLLAQLRHPNIVSVLDTGVEPAEEGTPAIPWLVTEWCDGVSLADEIDESRAAWAVGDTWAVLEPVLEALAHAHERGVAHRDLKPGNIMVVRREGRVSPRVLDFGVAKWLEGPSVVEGVATASDEVAFTLAYAAPEQAAREATGPWTDVHALALLFCELLGGERPYPGESRAAVLEAVFSPLRPIPNLEGREAGELREVLERALSLDPKQRQADAGALLVELRRALRVSTRTEIGPNSNFTQRSENFSEENNPSGSHVGKRSAPLPLADEPLTTGDVGVLEQPSIPAALGRSFWRRSLPLVALIAVVALGGALYDWRVRSLLSRGASSSPSTSVASSVPVSSVSVPASPTAHPTDCFDERLLAPRSLKRGWSGAQSYPQQTWGIHSSTLTFTKVGKGLPRTAMVLFYRHQDGASQTLTLSFFSPPKYHVAVRGLCSIAVVVEPDDDGEGEALLKDLAR